MELTLSDLLNMIQGAVIGICPPLALYFLKRLVTSLDQVKSDVAELREDRAAARAWQAAKEEADKHWRQYAKERLDRLEESRPIELQRAG